MRGSNAGPGGADIEGLGEFDEPDPERIRAAQEHGDLDADAGGLPLLSCRHRVIGFQKSTSHAGSLLVPAN